MEKAGKIILTLKIFRSKKLKKVLMIPDQVWLEMELMSKNKIDGFNIQDGKQKKNSKNYNLMNYLIKISLRNSKKSTIT